ncbi:MAG: cation:proton antiporter [Alphaproteobacteria bacterium]
MGAPFLSVPDFSIPTCGTVWQMAVGLEWLRFRPAGQLICRWTLVYPGLYPVFGISTVLLTFSLTQLINGNGFLAVYIAGIVMGNYAFLYRRHFINFQDSLAWIMQIGMFLILGLLVNPHELPGVFPISFLCSVALIFIARPLAVFLCLLQSEYTTRDKLFISWAGFKGAVPIILATYPMMYNFPNSGYLFNLIFFLVILSVLVQGNSLPWVARKLGLYRKN